uniref:Uncharacterized protein n=1 Tax=Rangifer tarandus platyrhynchus TaxID=3082113 RepID=A0ACB0FMK7_RANTA|nr:unnamed protein product [Rangifer tarandus platyrhynchus]
MSYTAKMCTVKFPHYRRRRAVRSGVCGAVCRPACGAGRDPENKQPRLREPSSRSAPESRPLRAPATRKI